MYCLAALPFAALEAIRIAYWLLNDCMLVYLLLGLM